MTRSTNTWSAGASLPAVRSHFEPGTFVRDGRIVAVGGKSGNTNQLTDITEYDPITNTWTALTPLPARLARACRAAGRQQDRRDRWRGDQRLHTDLDDLYRHRGGDERVVVRVVCAADAGPGGNRRGCGSRESLCRSVVTTPTDPLLTTVSVFDPTAGPKAAGPTLRRCPVPPAITSASRASTTRSTRLAA